MAPADAFPRRGRKAGGESWTGTGRDDEGGDDEMMQWNGAKGVMMECTPGGQTRRGLQGTPPLFMSHPSALVVCWDWYWPCLADNLETLGGRGGEEGCSLMFPMCVAGDSGADRDNLHPGGPFDPLESKDHLGQLAERAN